jgi:hypothetical protein
MEDGVLVSPHCMLLSCVLFLHLQTLLKQSCALLNSLGVVSLPGEYYLYSFYMLLQHRKFYWPQRPVCDEHKTICSLHAGGEYSNPRNSDGFKTLIDGFAFSKKQ